VVAGWRIKPRATLFFLSDVAVVIGRGFFGFVSVLVGGPSSAERSRHGTGVVAVSILAFMPDWTGHDPWRVSLQNKNLIVPL
jgi:uncharacterized membrane protein YedE/YeeE